jgi:prepilin-type N-terminal cleavage/methylation domain-containing protein
MRRRGFSLLEVLVAIALIIALLGAMFSFLWDVLSARARILDETGRRRAAATLLERLERDLMTSLVGDRVSGGGVYGRETSLRLLSRSVPARLAVDDPTRAFADLELTEYRFRQNAVEARRSVVTPGDRRPARGPFEPLGGPIHEVRFRYHDGTAWRSSFDSLRADRLPAAVEIAIWFDDPEPDDGFGDPGLDDDLEDPFGEEEDPFAMRFDEPGLDDGDDPALDDELPFGRDDGPPPDRLRVIIVPDPAGADDEETPR